MSQLINQVDWDEVTEDNRAKTFQELRDALDAAEKSGVDMDVMVLTRGPSPVDPDHTRIEGRGIVSPGGLRDFARKLHELTGARYDKLN